DVDVADPLAALLEHGLGGADQDAGGELEHLATVHRQIAAAVLGDPGAAAGEGQLHAPAAVCAQLEAEEAAALEPFELDGPGPVAEEDEGRPVGPVEDPREDVSADDERALGQAAGENPVGLRERVHTPRAAGRRVVGSSFAAA